MRGPIKSFITPAELDEVAVRERFGQRWKHLQQIGASNYQTGVQAMIHHVVGPPTAVRQPRRDRRASAAEQRQGQGHDGVQARKDAHGHFEFRCARHGRSLAHFRSVDRQTLYSVLRRCRTDSSAWTRLKRLKSPTLRAELAGYDDYARRVRWRLVPGIW
ncbi:hypothetical protein D3C85_1258400 [compost metagenome]